MPRYKVSFVTPIDLQEHLDEMVTQGFKLVTVLHSHSVRITGEFCVICVKDDVPTEEDKLEEERASHTPRVVQFPNGETVSYSVDEGGKRTAVLVEAE